MYGEQELIPSHGIEKTLTDFSRDLQQSIGLLGICEEYQPEIVAGMIQASALRFGHLLVYPTTALDAYNVYPTQWHKPSTRNLVQSQVMQAAAEKKQFIEAIVQQLPVEQRTKVTVITWEEVLAKPEFDLYWNVTRSLVNSRATPRAAPVLLQNSTLQHTQRIMQPIAGSFVRTASNTHRRKLHDAEYNLFKQKIDAAQKFHIHIPNSFSFEHLLLHALEEGNVDKIRSLYGFLESYKKSLPTLSHILESSKKDGSIKERVNQNIRALKQEAACLRKFFIHDTLSELTGKYDFDNTKRMVKVLFEFNIIHVLAQSQIHVDNPTASAIQNDLRELKTVIDDTATAVKDKADHDFQLDNIRDYIAEETAHLATLMVNLRDFLPQANHANLLNENITLHFIFPYDLTVPGNENPMFLMGKSMATELGYHFYQVIVTDKDKTAKEYYQQVDNNLTVTTSLPRQGFSSGALAEYFAGLRTQMIQERNQLLAELKVELVQNMMTSMQQFMTQQMLSQHQIFMATHSSNRGSHAEASHHEQYPSFNDDEPQLDEDTMIVSPNFMPDYHAPNHHLPIPSASFEGHGVVITGSRECPDWRRGKSKAKSEPPTPRHSVGHYSSLDNDDRSETFQSCISLSVHEQISKWQVKK